MIDDCTLLLCSYDGGEDCWQPFFLSLVEQWPEFNMPIVLNTESKSFSFSGLDIKSFGLYPEGKKVPWGNRMIETLERIETPYVLLILEDYWLDAPVDNEFFLKTLQWLKNNPDIATFSYYPCMPGENIQDNRFERFELRPQVCEYKLNAQVSIWRTGLLKTYIRPHESAWDWEIFGSQRASRYTEKFYTLIDGEKKVFSYGDPEKGCLIKKGKWVKEAVEPFIEKYDLDIDLSIRGFDDTDYSDIHHNRTLKEKLTAPHLIKRIVKKIKYLPTKWRSLKY